MVALRKVRSDTDLVHVDSMQHLLFPLPYNYHAKLDEGQWWIATAEVDGEKQLAGFCAIVPPKIKGDAAYLSRAGVMPAFRGKGLQRRFINTRVAWAKAQGITCVVTDTAPINPASSNNLIACGFRLYRPAHPWAAKDALYWIKRV